MIAVDTNVLVYAHRRDCPFNDAAFDAVAELATGRAPWAIPWPCVHEFLAIVTHARIYEPPSTLEQALEQVDAWLASPSLVLLGEHEDHWDELKRALCSGHVVGPRVHDARVAALCVGHGVRELWTVDRDFGRFPELHTLNPVARAMSD